MHNLQYAVHSWLDSQCFILVPSNKIKVHFKVFWGLKKQVQNIKNYKQLLYLLFQHVRNSHRKRLSFKEVALWNNTLFFVKPFSHEILNFLHSLNFFSTIEYFMCRILPLFICYCNCLLSTRHCICSIHTRGATLRLTFA